MSETDSPRTAERLSSFRFRWATMPEGATEVTPAMLAPGFRAGAAHCGLKGGGATDVALMVCDVPEVSSAILLTRNAAAAAPVIVCRDELEQDRIRAVAVNAGNANAATGEQGHRDALAMQAGAAQSLGLEPRSVAVAETGVIGVPLEIDRVVRGLGDASGSLAERGGEDFARAIMTTDKAPKLVTLQAAGVTVSAQAKGGGMIQPGFATMLCFVQTDAHIADPQAELRRAVARSFERITVDGQMSTNDTVVLQASGRSGKTLPAALLDEVLLALALEMVADGEGAERIGRVEVSGARDQDEAERVARAIANSPLVKTALTGRDANWGRIAQAAGMALAGEQMPEPSPDSIDFEELGAGTAEAEIGIDLGRGDAGTHLFFSDLSHEYIRINAEYTT